MTKIKNITRAKIITFNKIIYTKSSQSLANVNRSIITNYNI